MGFIRWCIRQYEALVYVASHPLSFYYGKRKGEGVGC